MAVPQLREVVVTVSVASHCAVKWECLSTYQKGEDDLRVRGREMMCGRDKREKDQASKTVTVPSEMILFLTSDTGVKKISESR